MVRRVKAYLAKMKVITDEEKLHELSMSCEGSSAGGSIMGSGPIRKRHPSPTLSTASSASSASEGLKNTGPKFGNYNIESTLILFVFYIGNIYNNNILLYNNSYITIIILLQNILGSASPQAVRKLLSLSEPSKTRLHQPRYHMAPSPGPPTRRNVHQPPNVPATSHERSQSDTTPLNPPPPLLLSSVDLNAESSSVTSLSNLSLRKTVTSSKFLLMNYTIVSVQCVYSFKVNSSGFSNIQRFGTLDTNERLNRCLHASGSITSTTTPFEETFSPSTSR